MKTFSPAFTDRPKLAEHDHVIHAARHQRVVIDRHVLHLVAVTFASYHFIVARLNIPPTFTFVKVNNGGTETEIQLPLKRLPDSSVSSLIRTGWCGRASRASCHQKLAPIPMGRVQFVKNELGGSATQQEPGTKGLPWNEQGNWGVKPPTPHQFEPCPWVDGG